MGDLARLPLGMCYVCDGARVSALSHLDEYVEAQTVDVVEVTQAEQAGEQAAGQHAHGEVQANGQPLSDDAAGRHTAMTSHQH